MAGVFDNHELSIPCATCGESSKKSIGWIKTHNELVCPCGQVIGLKSEQLLGELKKAEKALADFSAKLKRFGK
jgi:hypothetical protein